MPYKIILMFCLITLSHNQVNAQAMHWLSQPNGQLGAVQNHDTFIAKTSANGRYIAFYSNSSNLVAGDNNQREDLFVYDTLNNTTHRVSTTASGEIAGISVSFQGFSKPTSDGQWLAFIAYVKLSSNVSGTRFMYLKNLNTGALTVASNDTVLGNYEVGGDLHLADDASMLTFTTSENLDPLHTNFRTNLYQKNLSTNELTLLSKSVDNTTSSNDSIYGFEVSANNRYIAFISRATNLTADTVVGTNGYLLDRNSGVISLFTVKPNGQASTHNQSGPFAMSVSNQGQVAHTTTHNDLVGNDNNSKSDLFLFNGSQNIRINLTESGQEFTNPRVNSLVLSADGSRLIFSELNAILSSDTNVLEDIYLYDINSTQFSQLTSLPLNPVVFQTPYVYAENLSANGQKLLMISNVNLNNSPNNSFSSMLFQFDLNTQQIKHINPIAFNPNTITADVFPPKISADQRWALYSSITRNLTTQLDNDATQDLFLLDRDIDQHQKIGRNVLQSNSNISSSGQFIVFTSEFFQPNGTVNLGDYHVFLYNRNNQQYTQIAAGFQPSVNDAGKVVFSSYDNLTAADTNSHTDVYLFDPSNNSLSLVSVNSVGVAGNAGSFSPKISGSSSNQWIVFTSEASDLVLADTNSTYDVFMRSWPNGVIFRVSQRATLEEGNDFSYNPSISYDGAVISFSTYANNLTNNNYQNSYFEQVLVYERDTQLLELVSQDSNGDALSRGTDGSSTSTSGRYIAYTTSANVLIEDTDNNNDIYLYDRDLGTTVLISKSTSNLQSSNGFNGAEVIEDLTTTPSLLGVVFSGGGDLTGVTAHPGHAEAFLYQQGGPNVELDIMVTGMGIVNGSLGINCFTNCSSNYPLGTELTLVATPDAGYLFDRWESSRGQCRDNNNPCQLTMNRDKTLQAVFIDENEVIFKAGFE